MIASATFGRQRVLTVYTEMRLASPADLDSISGTVRTTPTVAGQRRRNHSNALAAAPMSASTAKMVLGEPGIQP